MTCCRCRLATRTIVCRPSIWSIFRKRCCVSCVLVCVCVYLCDWWRSDLGHAVDVRKHSIRCAHSHPKHIAFGFINEQRANGAIDCALRFASVLIRVRMRVCALLAKQCVSEIEGNNVADRSYQFIRSKTSAPTNNKKTPQKNRPTHPALHITKTKCVLFLIEKQRLDMQTTRYPIRRAQSDHILSAFRVCVFVCVRSRSYRFYRITLSSLLAAKKCTNHVLPIIIVYV